ncbi:MAG: hydantoinase/oxoprolinase family protein, partial [Actinomycetota bacterium]|nr:hydantoinase/oxoprolinase family protein [Actinomycetota bacterium]
ALRVGPRSAGADPGPACYGRGGTEPTVTDAALALGHLDAASPLSGEVELDLDAALSAIGKLAGELSLTTEQAAAGIARVAAVEMARAVRVVTVERGIDPRDLALVAFGGAGPMHAAAVAAELEMSRVVAPVSSGVLSALGLIVSERRRDVTESVLLAGEDLTADAAAAAVRRLGERGREELGAPDAELRAVYDLRYAGQAFELSIAGEPEPDPSDLRAAFDRAHHERYGYRDDEAELELVTVRVAAALPGAQVPEDGGGLTQVGSREARFGGEDEVEARVLSFGQRGESSAEGPAVIELGGATLVVPPAWTARAQGDAVTMERR